MGVEGDEVAKARKTTLAEVIAARARALGIDLTEVPQTRLADPLGELEHEPENLGLPLSTVLKLLAAVGIDPEEVTLWTTARVDLSPPTYASVIRGHRHRLKMTQAELAEKIGIPKNSLVQLETGRRRPSLPMATRIAKAFGESLDIFSECER